MKTKYIETFLLLHTWKEGVNQLLFPDFLKDELNPEDYLSSFGDRLSVLRENHRKDVNDFIETIFETETPGELWSLIRKTDSRVMALYYDRILAATFSLETICSEKQIVEIPESWETLALFLLLQKFFG